MVCALSGPATFPYFMASAVLAVGRTSFNGVCLANFTNRISVRLTPSTGIQRFSFLASLAFCFIRTPSFDLNRAVGVNPAACGARKSHFSVFPFDVIPRSYAPASGTVARGDFTHDAFIFSVARQDRLSYIASIHFCPPELNYQNKTPWCIFAPWGCSFKCRTIILCFLLISRCQPRHRKLSD